MAEFVDSRLTLLLNNVSLPVASPACLQGAEYENAQWLSLNNCALHAND